MAGVAVLIDVTLPGAVFGALLAGVTLAGATVGTDFAAVIGDELFIHDHNDDMAGNLSSIACQL